jgi:hypothetical protein
MRFVAALVALVLLVIAAPAQADPFTQAAPPPPAPPVRVLALHAELDAEGMLELAAEMRLAGQQAVVLVHGPASARVSGPVPSDVLATLKNAAADVQLDVLVEPADGDPGNAAAFVAALPADHVYVLPGASLGACATPCQPTQRIADGDELQSELGDGIVLDGSLANDPLATGEPKPDGGIDPKLVAVPAIVVIGLALGLLAGRRRRPAPRARPRDATRAPAPPAPRPARARRPRDPSLPGSGRPPAHSELGRARVHSELQPEGYVEIDGCLRRVRWAGPGEPPAPGETVRVESHGGRLAAHPGRSR